MKKTFRINSFCNISNLHNGFIWTPSKVQRHFLNELRVSFKSIDISLF